MPVTVSYDAQRELRLGVVLYGGVSLAIYIHGVTKELMSMVRATAPAGRMRAWQRLFNGGMPALVPNDELKAAERIYRRLGQMLTLDGIDEAVSETSPIRTRIVVDILAGTSAGGINAIYLAKALATQAPMDALAALWIDEGDIERLINDDNALTRDKDVARLDPQQPPQSLLHSRKMYAKLLAALHDMSSRAPQSNGGDRGQSPLVDELDLFITATDIAGLPLPIQLSDRFVWERRHKAMFRFRYAPLDEREAHHDFTRENDPFLAFAARCTSAFPFAFEPMTLADIDAVLSLPRFAQAQYPRSDHPAWRRFYQDYLRGRPNERPDTKDGERAQRFAKVAFGDGGYLDNKPFTQAIRAIRARSASVPVDRKLLYVEPSPEHPQHDALEPPVPDAFQNAIKALLEIPRYETIREDLDDVRAYNRLIERLDIVRSGRDDDLRLGLGWELPELPNAKEWRRWDLRQMVERYGFGYGMYHRLKVAAVTDELTRFVVRLLDLDAMSDDFMLIRHVVGAWRAQRYAIYRSADDGDDRKTENEFLYQYDLWWRLRRVRTAIGRVDQAIGLSPTPDALADWLARTETEHDGNAPNSPPPDRGTLLLLKAALAEAQDALIDGMRALDRGASRNERRIGDATAAPSALERHAVTMADAWKNWRERLEVRNDAARRAAAEALVASHLETFDAFAEAILDIIAPARARAGAIVGAALHGRPIAPDKVTLPEPLLALLERLNAPSAASARRLVGQYYDRFEEYDQVTYPLLYAGETGELDPIEVIRISPEDAVALYDETRGMRRGGPGEAAEVPVAGPRPKLAGSAFGHFGAFLAEDWRRNDMLWGRLDGAERLIGAMLPSAADSALREKLVVEAHAAILEDELGSAKLDEIITTLGSHYIEMSRNLDEWLAQFRNDIKARKLHAILLHAVDPERRGAFFVAASQSSREPPARKTLGTLARATDVIGRMLDAAAEKTGLAAGSRSSRAIAWLGRQFWRLVQVSVPRTLGNLFARHWLGLLYLFEAFLVAGGWLLAEEQVARFGWTTLGMTLGVHALLTVLGAMGTWRAGRRALHRLFLLIVAALAVLGAVYVLTQLGEDARMLWERALQATGLRG